MLNEHHVSTQNEGQVRATVQDRTPKPAGLLPKHTQQLVILGVAVVMVLVMWVTSGGKRTRSSGPGQSPADGSSAQAPNPAAVEDFKHAMQQEQAAVRQPISPANLARLEALGLAGDVPASTVVPPAEAAIPPPGEPIGNAAANGTAYQADPLKEDKRKRQYLSLFAPNVAFTFRTGTDVEPSREPKSAVWSPPSASPEFPPSTDLQSAPFVPEAQTPVPTRAAASRGTVALPSPRSAEPPENVHTDSGQMHSELWHPASSKSYVLFEGTVLETILLNRLNGSFAGPVTCLVSTDLYSHDRQHVLVPSGSKVLGEAKKVESTGQERLAVFFHRLLMPDGYSVTLDQFKGLSQAGETALRDRVDSHYLQIFGASLAIGILGGVAQAGTGNVLTNSSLDRIREGFGGNLANSGSAVLDHFLNILPTVTIREGSRVKIYLAGDLLLPDYAEHNMEPDL